MQKWKFITAILAVPLMAGCATETVDKGPPKFGQTVERPHPAEEAFAADRANTMQQTAATPQTVVPGDANASQGGADNSIFENNSSQNVVTNPPQTNQITPASPPTNSGAAATPNSPSANNGQ